MADAVKTAKQGIAKNVSSTGHLGPLLDLFSFVDKPSEIPYTPRKRKSKKRRTKERAKNRPDSGNNGHERKAKVEKKSSQPPQPATYPYRSDEDTIREIMADASRRYQISQAENRQSCILYGAH
ncbi:unnamed protein product [Porites lobata]|uniref:Uncharacterized protein n=1 Tax=Porites lobata TaxID=104759 RepID=A0ABN8MSW6_9CNID|nr:unnamed protein product [Porites lobata]